MIIALIGAERVGKDTFADILVSEYGFKKHSMADPIREISNIIFPHWFMLKSDTNSSAEFTVDKDSLDQKSGICPRDFLKWLGTDIFQLDFHQRFPDAAIPQRSIWSSICAEKIINSNSQDSEIGLCNWVIPDVRFKHEAEQLGRLGCHFINLVPSCSPSDDGLLGQSTYDIPYILETYKCYKIVNNKTAGIPELRKNISELLSQIPNKY